MNNILLLIVNVGSQGPKNFYGDFAETIYYSLEEKKSWKEVLNRIEKSPAQWVLKIYSNETIVNKEWTNSFTVYEHAYDRLFRKDIFLAFPSLPNTINNHRVPSLLFPNLQKREFLDNEKGFNLTRAVYLIEQKEWKMAEIMVQQESEQTQKPELHFVMAYIYFHTNRFQEGLVSINNAINQFQENTEIPIAEMYFLKGKMYSGLDESENAVKLFQESFLGSWKVDPIVAWAEEIKRLGETEGEITSKIQQFLRDSNINSIEYIIETLCGIGAYSSAMRWMESTTMNKRKYECLMITGKTVEAMNTIQKLEIDTPEKVIDFVLCSLSEGIFPNDQQKQLLERLDQGDVFIELLRKPENKLGLLDHDRIKPLIERLLNRALQLKMLQIVEKIGQEFYDSLELGKKLFQYGYVMSSANYFLDALENKNLDLEGYRYLGEILYFQKNYEEASSFFEYLHSQSNTDPTLRTALLLSNLHQSEQLLSNALLMFPSSVFLKEEKEKVKKNIKVLEKTNALTHWTAKEMENYNV
jgi:tetratricopeptide (TPR) repeat protein